MIVPSQFRYSFNSNISCVEAHSYEVKVEANSRDNQNLDEKIKRCKVGIILS